MIALILVLALIGVGLYLLETYVPMAPPLRLIIRVVVVVAVILYLLQVFGIGDIPVPRIR